MTKLLAIAVPILPGKTDQWKKFTNELKTNRLKEFNDSRKKLNVYERTFLQSTPKGDMALFTIEGENPESAFQKMGQGTDEFTKWFNNQVMEIHNFDLTKVSKEGMPSMMVESTPIAETVAH